MPSNTSITWTVLEAFRIRCFGCILGRKDRYIYNPINQFNRIVRISIKVDDFIALWYTPVFASIKIVYIIAVNETPICTPGAGGELTDARCYLNKRTYNTDVLQWLWITVSISCKWPRSSIHYLLWVRTQPITATILIAQWPMTSLIKQENLITKSGLLLL